MQEPPAAAAAAAPALPAAQQAQQPSSAAGAPWEAAAQLRRASEKALNMPTPPATTPGPEDTRPLPLSDPAGARCVFFWVCSVTLVPHSCMAADILIAWHVEASLCLPFLGACSSARSQHAVARRSACALVHHERDVFAQRHSKASGLFWWGSPLER